jgi:hypothetical protein
MSYNALQITKLNNNYIEAEIVEKTEDGKFHSVGGINGHPDSVEKELRYNWAHVEHIIFMNDVVPIGENEIFNMAMEVASIGE